MKKAKYLLYSLDIILAVLMILIQLKLTGSFIYPEQEEFVNFLLKSQLILFVLFIACIIITVVVRWIYNDIKEELNYLHIRISETDKKQSS